MHKEARAPPHSPIEQRQCTIFDHDDRLERTISDRENNSDATSAAPDGREWIAAPGT